MQKTAAAKELARRSVHRNPPLISLVDGVGPPKRADRRNHKGHNHLCGVFCLRPWRKGERGRCADPRGFTPILTPYTTDERGLLLYFGTKERGEQSQTWKEWCVPQKVVPGQLPCTTGSFAGGPPPPQGYNSRSFLYVKNNSEAFRSARLR
jgi:hypothetical protein